MRGPHGFAFFLCVDSLGIAAFGTGTLADWRNTSSALHHRLRLGYLLIRERNTENQVDILD
ncbi:hypothetical protein DL95DRAFT_394610 [Leptodontidium sp. 2 PMI_412]|nr:hypothetical protein DL95DRAFT_394610 [Leptodontidium sp. 2 PMI_412]